jgi:hypothetical protein
MPLASEPVPPEVPPAGLSPHELALDVLARIDRANDYARSRKRRFRSSSSVVMIVSLTLSVTSTIILGLQDLDGWAGVAFALVAVVTTVNALEPFFAWRSRWVLMEETQSKLYSLRDELTYYLAATDPGQVREERLRAMFDRYQQIWDQLSNRWMEYRRASGREG